MRISPATMKATRRRSMTGVLRPRGTFKVCMCVSVCVYSSVSFRLHVCVNMECLGARAYACAVCQPVSVCAPRHVFVSMSLAAPRSSLLPFHL